MTRADPFRLLYLLSADDAIEKYYQQHVFIFLSSLESIIGRIEKKQK